MSRKEIFRNRNKSFGVRCGAELFLRQENLCATSLRTCFEIGGSRISRTTNCEQYFEWKFRWKIATTSTEYVFRIWNVKIHFELNQLLIRIAHKYERKEKELELFSPQTFLSISYIGRNLTFFPNTQGREPRPCQLDNQIKGF